jgi:hypothetical protein
MTSSTTVNLFAVLVVAATGVLLVGFAGMVYARPAMAERVLMKFASSARAHYLEQTLRVLLGVSLVLLSPTMWQGKAFWILGWCIVISSVVLMLIPWRVHHRFAGHVLPRLVAHMKLFSVGVFFFGAILLVSLPKS